MQPRKAIEMNKVLATLIAGLFAVGAFAQAPAAPAAPAAPVKAAAPAVAPVAAREKAEPKKEMIDAGP